MDDTTLLSKFEPKPIKQVIEYERQLFQARFSPCGKFLIASGYDANIQRWAVSGNETKRLSPCLGHHAWVPCLAFIPTTERIVSADSWGQIAVWQYADETPAPVWKNDTAHDGWVRAVAVSPDGQRIASGGNDRMLRIWSAADGKLLKEWPHPEKIFSLCFHPSGSPLVSGDLKGVIRDWDDGQLLREMQMGKNDDGFAYDAIFHPAGFVMATSCAFPGKGFVWCWTPQSEKPFFESTSIPNGRSLSLHPDGRRIALLVSKSANGNGRVLVQGVYQGGSAQIHILEF